LVFDNKLARELLNALLSSEDDPAVAEDLYWCLTGSALMSLLVVLTFSMVVCGLGLGFSSSVGSSTSFTSMEGKTGGSLLVY